jgi:hypothetical protein
LSFSTQTLVTGITEKWNPAETNFGLLKPTLCSTTWVGNFYLNLIFFWLIIYMKLRATACFKQLNFEYV